MSTSHDATNPSAQPATAIERATAFKALDAIDQALGNAEGTMALFSAMVDNDIENDPAIVGAIERHLVADVAVLRAAFTKARGDLFTGGAR